MFGHSQHKAIDYRLCLIGIGMVLLTGCSALRSKPVTPEDILDMSTGVDSCPVHHQVLIEAVQPLTRAHCDYAFEYTEAKRKKFPYAFLDMCDPYTDKSYCRVYYCPACRRAEYEFGARDLESRVDQLRKRGYTDDANAVEERAKMFRAKAAQIPDALSP